MRKIWTATLFSMAIGCGAPVDGAENPDCDGASCTDDGSSGPPAGGTAADDGAGETGGGGEGPARSSGASGGDGGDGGNTSDIPCDVQDLLATNCWMCHGDPPAFGAPMPLTTAQDFHVPAVTDNTRPVSDLVLERIVDANKPMPQGGLMSPDDAAILSDWIDAGLPVEAGADCHPTDPPDGGWGPQYLPCDPDSAVAAFAPDGGADGFEVPVVDDLYQCFVFDSPFTADQQGIAWAPIIGDSRVVHHMLLLASDDASLQPGSVVPNCGSLSYTTSMLYGWAPGGPNGLMPPEAGLELPDPGQRLILQVHYHNAAGYTDAIDSSGFAMCTTDTPRDNAAGTLWLGTTDINIPAGESASASGDCNTDRAGEPTTVLMSWPHMHNYGTSFATEILRLDGSVETLIDVPTFNFNNQTYYEHKPPVVLQPGDILRTTCNYTNTSDGSVSFGEGTADEMCFNFAMVYPIDAYDFHIPLVPPATGRLCVAGLLPF